MKYKLNAIVSYPGKYTVEADLARTNTRKCSFCKGRKKPYTHIKNVCAKK